MFYMSSDVKRVLYVIRRRKCFKCLQTANVFICPQTSNKRQTCFIRPQTSKVFYMSSDVESVLYVLRRPTCSICPQMSSLFYTSSDVKKSFICLQTSNVFYMPQMLSVSYVKMFNYWVCPRSSKWFLLHPRRFPPSVVHYMYVLWCWVSGERRYLILKCFLICGPWRKKPISQ